MFHKRTKHIDAKFHYIRELVNNGEIILKHCRTQKQFADILTKPLGHKSFEFLRKGLGMTDNPAVEIKGECWNLISNCPEKSAGQKLNEKRLNGCEFNVDGNLDSHELNAGALEELHLICRNNHIKTFTKQI